MRFALIKASISAFELKILRLLPATGLVSLHRLLHGLQAPFQLHQAMRPELRVLLHGCEQLSERRLLLLLPPLPAALHLLEAPDKRRMRLCT